MQHFTHLNLGFTRDDDSFMHTPLSRFLLLALFASPVMHAQQAAVPFPSNALENVATHRPLSYGALFQGGNGLTQERNGFKFFQAGVHVGKVLTGNFGPGLLRGNFEYAAELFPYWQSFTPKFQRSRCMQVSPASGTVTCSQPYTDGGTFSGVTVTPIILRWNFERKGKLVPWAQAAGGLLWTNHKYPAFGSTSPSLIANGPNGDASVFNFTPQGGVGVHYFLRPNRSLDLGANGVHISSASLGDRNPGVNASVQFSLGYSWWK